MSGSAIIVYGCAETRHGSTSSAAPTKTFCLEVPRDGWPRNTLVLDRRLAADESEEHQAPLYALVPTSEGWWPYIRVSYNPAESVLLALDGGPLRPDPHKDLTACLAELAARQREVLPAATNHQRCFINARPGLELEHKFSLAGAPDIWTLALRVLDSLSQRAIPGWVSELGNNHGFEEWDFPTHLFAFDQEPIGHVAYIPAVDGSWIRRAKWGQPDARVRTEELTSGLLLGDDPDLPQLVRESFHREPSWQGGYRRIRYNVMLESPHTGHIFSIMFDRCIDLGAARADLFQAEVEYIRSRTLRRSPQEADGLAEQWEDLITWTRAYLVQAGVKAIENHMSKLSWLRPSESAEQGIGLVHGPADRPP